MTIQNIEDVMDRIMTLNRNLNEESLKTLLSASGWDKEDIMEGLRIFKLSNKNTVTAIPAPATKVVFVDREIPVPAPAKIEEENILNNEYSFNIKKKEDPIYNEDDLVINDKKSESVEDVIDNNDVNLSSDSFIQNTEDKNIKNVNINKEQKIDENITEKYISQNTFTEKKNISISKMISLILLAILLLLALAYLFIPKFTLFIDQGLFGKKNNTNINLPSKNINNISNSNNNVNIMPIDTNLDNLNNLDKNINANTSSTSAESIEKTEPNIKLEDLTREIEKLKIELASYKQNTPSTQTIIKYISQKGATGAAGKGIAAISATSTGFVINYTDKTSVTIPYSTTTILNILNSQGVCFRDQNATTSSSTDICLDKAAVLRLINK